jgi:hypothetical protein
MKWRTTRSIRGVAALAAGTLLGLVAAACSPPATAPGVPNVTGHLQIQALPLGEMGTVTADAWNFPGSGPYSVTWSLRDTRADREVFSTSGDLAGESHPSFTGIIELGRFQVNSAGGVSNAAIEATVTLSRGGASASATVTGNPAWATPSNPLSGSIVTTSPYQATQVTPVACAPIGTTVHVAVSGQTTGAAAFFYDMGVPFGTGAVALSTSGTDLTTTKACWQLTIVRADLAGGLTGAMNYSISW